MSNVVMSSQILCLAQKKPCKDEISNAATQERVEAKLSTASHYGASDWWLGLDDVDVEGELFWSSGHQLKDGDYNNWEPTMPPTHPDKDCAVIDEYIDWKWRMDDCDVPRSFICQAVTCESPVRFDPDETRADISLCDPECPPHHSCNNGTCVCSELFYHYNCSWVSGMDAALEEKNFDRNFLFFKQKADWADASDFCEGIGGTLAMPKTKPRHDYIYEKMMEVGLNITKASWLGMHDLDNDGQWQFMDGEAVNLPPVFENMTADGAVPMYFRNTTGIDERWHFYFNESTHFTTYENGKKFCELIDSHLPIVREARELERITAYIK
uniref:C-type mannose receptor 2-like n=1 Tax=Ciona intestinalis TaxID=7719 RepID=UPI000EF4C5D3